MKILATVDRFAQQALRWMVILLMVSMTAIVFLQVVFRYVFDAPLDWTEEVARFTFVWVSFLGAAGLTRLGQHIDVTIFRMMLPKRLQVVAKGLGHLLALLCVYFFLSGGLDITQREWNQVAPSTQVPMGWIYIAIPVAAALMAVWIVADLLRMLFVSPKGERS